MSQNLKLICLSAFVALKTQRQGLWQEGLKKETAHLAMKLVLAQLKSFQSTGSRVGLMVQGRVVVLSTLSASLDGCTIFSLVNEGKAVVTGMGRLDEFVELSSPEGGTFKQEMEGLQTAIAGRGFMLGLWVLH